MKNTLGKLFLFAFCIMFACCGSDDNGEKEQDNGGGGTSQTIETAYLPIADPYVLLHDGTYYAYGTGDLPDGSQGIACFTSKDLTNWKRAGAALRASDSYADRWFWAPEVYHVNGKFYMFYSADEHICVATSDSPEGPFRQSEQKPIWNEKSIDTDLFIDDDGTPYLYFVRFTDGNVIWVAEMEKDLMSIKTETLRQCVKAEEPWETVQAKVAEGPSVLKKDGKYYMLYSANDYQSQLYGVGYATSDSPMGPWTKYGGNPILQKVPSAGLVGTGHGAPFQTVDGKWKYIFHAHWSKMSVQPRTSYFLDFNIDSDGVATIGGKLIKPRVLK